MSETLVPRKEQEEPEPDTDERFERRMTFAEHLEELRGNVIRSVYVLVGLMIVGFVFRTYVEHFVAWPYELVRDRVAEETRHLPPEERIELPPLSGYDMTEAFFFTLRVVFYAALLLGTPYFLFEMWRFISAGLYKRERRAVMRVLPVSLLLFFIGAAFSYLVLVPISVEFMMTWSKPSFIKVEPRLDSYLSFFLILTLMLGVVFQLPLIQVVVARFGILSAERQAGMRRGFILAAVVAAAVITPTGDPVTLSLVAVPMLLLYEIGIMVARRVSPRKRTG